MAIDMDAMLAKIKDRQWALADIDWDAPGAETIDDDFRPRLKAFMADLCWIENIGARGFAALAKKAPTPTIAEIYRYFHAEEQRHANAELALMKRWGMLDDGEMPGRTNHVFAEESARGLYRRWAELLSCETWAEVERRELANR